MTTLSDLLAVRQKRLSLQREADLLEQQEKGLQSLLIDAMRKEGKDELYEGAVNVQLRATQEPVVLNWPDLLDYIAQTGDVDLLQKRVTASAVKARWDNDVSIPGVIADTKYSLKFNV